MDNTKALEMTFSLMNTIATGNPETLDMVITDQVLILIMQDLDYKMKQELEKYMSYANYTPSENELSSKKELAKDLKKIIGRTLLSYYNLFGVYETIRAQRNLSFTCETNINSIHDILKQDGFLAPSSPTL